MCKHSSLGGHILTTASNTLRILSHHNVQASFRIRNPSIAFLSIMGHFKLTWWFEKSEIFREERREQKHTAWISLQAETRRWQCHILIKECTQRQALKWKQHLFIHCHLDNCLKKEKILTRKRKRLSAESFEECDNQFGSRRLQDLNQHRHPLLL